ncbi:hypothetical protein ACIGXI_36345 [Kitasatospora aureofaciens]
MSRPSRPWSHAVQSTTEAGRQAAQTTAGDLKEVGQDAARQAREQAQD